MLRPCTLFSPSLLTTTKGATATERRPWRLSRARCGSLSLTWTVPASAGSGRPHSRAARTREKEAARRVVFMAYLMAWALLGSLQGTGRGVGGGDGRGRRRRRARGIGRRRRPARRNRCRGRRRRGRVAARRRLVHAGRQLGRLGRGGARGGSGAPAGSRRGGGRQAGRGVSCLALGLSFERLVELGETRVVGPHVAVVRGELERLAIVLKRLVEIALGLVGHAEVVVHPRVLRVRALGLVEAEERLAPQPAPRHVDAERELGRGAIGLAIAGAGGRGDEQERAGREEEWGEEEWGEEERGEGTRRVRPDRRAHRWVLRQKRHHGRWETVHHLRQLRDQQVYTTAPPRLALAALFRLSLTACRRCASCSSPGTLIRACRARRSAAWDGWPRRRAGSFRDSADEASRPSEGVEGSRTTARRPPPCRRRSSRALCGHAAPRPAMPRARRRGRAGWARGW